MTKSPASIKIAIIAPHLQFPLRNGADQYIARKWGALDSNHFEVTMLAADGSWLLREGEWIISYRSKSPQQRSKIMSAIRMLFGADYHSSRFNTPAFVSMCKSQLTEARYDLMVSSYPSSYQVSRGFSGNVGRHAVETHNFEPKIYLDRAVSTTGIRSLLNLLSSLRTFRCLRDIPPEAHVIALGESDCRLFELFGFGSVIESRMGYAVRPDRSVFPSDKHITISFVGALSVSMNDHAIRTFVSRFLPILRESSLRHVSLAVIGSNPSAHLRAFLENNQVDCFFDVSDQELENLVCQSHATIVPFNEVNGQKLKFGLSASVGVPVLSFIPAPLPLAGVRGVIESLDMRAWSEFLEVLAEDPVYHRDIAVGIQHAARSVSWQAIIQAELDRMALWPSQLSIPNAPE